MCVTELKRISKKAERVFIDHKYDEQGRDIGIKNMSRVIAYFRLNGDLYYIQMLVSKEVQSDKEFMQNYIDTRMYQKAQIIHSKRRDDKNPGHKGVSRRV